MEAARLANRFDIPEAIRLEDGPGGLVHAVISTPAADGDLYLQGGHLAHWTPRGQRPVLFVSPKSLFAPGKAIRGGVPIIFPWFGSRGDGKPGPAHGFARTSEWTMESARLREDGRMELTLALASEGASRVWFDSTFRLRLRVTLGSDLEMELETRNDGSEPFTYEQALHTYLAIGDIRQVSISVLERNTYIDNTNGFKRKKQDLEHKYCCSNGSL
jgi:glucose-6-phosphate 1-epimerase